MKVTRNQDGEYIADIGQHAGLAVAAASMTQDDLQRLYIEQVMADIRVELEYAMFTFPAMNSPHEGHAVIREEFEELWEHVRANTGRGPQARREAVQVAAMAIRYIHDLSEDA